MSKKTLLSCTAVAAIVLFGTHLNVQATETLTADSGEVKTPISGTTYQQLHALNGGKIYGTDVTLEKRSAANESSIVSNGSGSIIELTGNKTTIKDTAEILPTLKDIPFIWASNGGKIKITDGSIYKESNKKDEFAEIDLVRVDNNSTLELNNVDITVTASTLRARDIMRVINVSSDATFNMNGGSIEVCNVATIITVEGDEEGDVGGNNINVKNVHIYGNSDKTHGKSAYGLNVISARVTLKNTTIEGMSSGINVDGKKSQVIMIGGSIKDSEQGVKVYGGSISLEDVEINAIDDGIWLYGGDHSVQMTGGKVTANTAFSVIAPSSIISATDVFATAKEIGINLDCFFGENVLCNSSANLTNTKLFVEDGIGLNINRSVGSKINLNNSEIHADVLLKGIMLSAVYKKPNMFTLAADHSLLEGRADVSRDAKTVLDLKNGTKWFVKTSTKEKDSDGNPLDIVPRSRSDVSVLNLNNSSIVFQGPVEERYHTLHIGSGKPETTAVYNASGDAKIGFNMAWSDGNASADQKTDRLLIHGDVSGTTTVYVKSDLGDKKGTNTDPSNTGGISLIQVSGKAGEDSFKLENGYTTLGGLPYKYILTAYGPTSTHGKADIEQSLFDEQDKNFWDFRLHKAFLESGSGGSGSGGSGSGGSGSGGSGSGGSGSGGSGSGGSGSGGSGSGGSGSGGGIAALVPQAASYIVMPNALFYAGFTDIAKQSALLADIRTTQNYSFFFSPYGSTATLASQRGPLKYGYGADIRYAAAQAGASLLEIESQNITTHFGLIGTYGQISFTPKQMEGADKSTLNKWALTAYGSLEHNNGLYVDLLASYGMLNGDIATALIKSTAKLKDTTTLSASATVGKKFATGMAGIELEPQAQLAYQHLMFKPINDANDLTIDMNNPSQWLIRVGGRFTKSIATENNHPLSFYGKVNFIKTFGDDGNITIGDNFDLDPMGSALEGGLGINAQLSHNLSLHGDVSYQQKLQKTGISGASFSGGIRYQF
ncbi:autotransporter outer membrane beta-barrel domain-containing protein [Bartonella vinsonii]|uniref:Type V secretory pathway, adhesin AidA n=1 Tax=Bartonella vinsonii TaxID=33047 RepID=A0A448V845_BARVI|nr:autotransporter outer membrane beta-barrel domain-containing protein [Bartonella vinsonii]VEJ45933.1 Type V secretory pathway, adhesin AidA [Bartonella vinsonii]